MHKVLISPFHNPYLNLALENYFFETLDSRQPLLFLYVNEPSVIIGRFQNPWIESRPYALGPIHLVRRQSGGGTVYHDPGNVNFSFISSQEEYDKTANLEIICCIMKKAGVNLSINERHDLTVRFQDDVYKVSGSAFRLKKDKVFHHGTLLITSDREKLKKAITPDRDRHFLKTGGTASKRSKVISLSKVVQDLTVDSVISFFRESFQLFPADWKTLQNTETVQREIVSLKSEEWVYEKTPPFIQDLSALFPGEEQLMEIEVKKAVITKTPESLNYLTGIPYGRKETGTILRSRIESSIGDRRIRDESYSRLVRLIR